MIYLVSLVIVLGVVLVVLYNRLVRLRNLALEGWSGIDVQLKRRYDLIPNLVEAVKGYSGHEKQTLEEVSRLRTESIQVTSLGKKGALESNLSGQFKKIFALAESYPDLKANQNFLDLQRALTEVEDNLQYARRYYNGAVRNLNTVIECFPGNVLASHLGFSKMEFFEIEFATERNTPEVKL